MQIMWIKICGIKNQESARAVADLHPSAIGLNFYRKTPRCVDGDVAQTITRELDKSVEFVGLFVNHTLAEVISICDHTGIKTLQIHGDESEEFLASVLQQRPDLQLVRAFRIGDEGLQPIAKYLANCARLNVPIHRVLVDSHVKDQYGGTGQTVAWETVAHEYRYDTWPPLILAGGLTADNVAAAIQAVRPWGVDVSSGVESSTGVKDPEKVREFIANARAAFDKIGDGEEDSLRNEPRR